MVTKDKKNSVDYNFGWGMIKPFATGTLVGDAGYTVGHMCPQANRGEGLHPACYSGKFGPPAAAAFKGAL